MAWSTPPPETASPISPSSIWLRKMLTSNSDYFVTGAVSLMASPSGWSQAPLNTVAMLDEYFQGFCPLPEGKESDAWLPIAVAISVKKQNTACQGRRKGRRWVFLEHTLPFLRIEGRRWQSPSCQPSRGPVALLISKVDTNVGCVGLGMYWAGQSPVTEVLTDG